MSAAERTQAQQQISAEDTFWVSDTDSTHFLNHWIIENSLRISIAGEEIPRENNWRINYNSGEWQLLNDVYLAGADSVLVHAEYSRLPFTLRPVYFQRELRPFTPAEDDTAAIDADRVVQPAITGEALFGSSRLQRSGSLSRGITVGSAQDLSLDSGLRFELSGFITDDVEVLATLTDQSTPIQPDGSTQNLREFDKVYIQLRHELGQLQLGDVDVDYRTSEFAQISRRLQGGDVEVHTNRYGSYQASAAVVRGRFRVMEFEGRDGVQGPYRLTGAEGETFIIVLAGTERVYLNGNLLTRGEENDYIIDYGLGEITFTQNRMITDVSRITVDFQYVTEEYNRTLVAAEASHDQLFNGRLSVGASFVREADSRNLNTEVGLSDEEIRILREAGDDLESATISGADSVGFRTDVDFILYARVDTTFQSDPVTIFRHIPGDSSGVWRVRFSRVGDGLGSYRRAQSTSNGIVYEWVGPGMGAYEPFRRIPAPQAQQMAAIRSSFSLTDHLELYGEWAVSDLDRNRFSQLDNDNNQDMAFLSGFRVKPLETVFGSLSADVRHRYTGTNFTFFDRTREVEFERIWNITRLDNVEENLTEADIGLEFSPYSQLSLGGGLLNRTDLRSIRQKIRLTSAEPDLPELDYRADYLLSDDLIDDDRGRWFRQMGSVSYNWHESPVPGVVTPIFRIETEDRRQRIAGTDSLRNTSFYFYDLGPGVRWNPTEALRAGVHVSYRRDHRAAQGDMRFQAEAWTREFRLSFEPSDVFRTRNSVIVRDKTYSDFFVTEQQAQNSRGVLVNSVTDIATRDQLFELNLFYEGGTESRPLLQETYIEVQPGQGQFIWIDINEDGVQQIDEFFPATTPNEGNFIRQFIPSDELFPVVRLNTRVRSRLDPSRVYHGEGGIAGAVLGNITLTSLLDIREQSRTEDIADIYLMRLNRFRDPDNTIEGRLYWQQDVQLFRPNRDFDLRFIIDRTLGLNQRASGREDQHIRNLRLESSYRFLPRWVAEVELKSGINDFESEQLQARSFNIRSRGVSPGLRFDYSRSLQLGTGFSYNNRRDTLPAETARVNSYSLNGDVRWFYQNLIQSFARLEYRSNQLEGVSSSFGSFELTDGAGAGNTWLWSVQFTYRISQFLRASVNYDGRTVQDRPTIQTLRFVMNAVF